MPKKIPIEEFENRFYLANRQELTVDLTTYKSYTQKCKFIDIDFGEWWTYPRYIIKLKCKHPKRSLIIQSENKKINIKEVKRKIKKAHGNNVIIDESTYDGIEKKSRFIDKDYGEFYSLVRHICNGHLHPKKGIIKCTQSNTASIEYVVSKLKEVHGNVIQIKPETYISTGKKATFIHKKYGEWEATPNNVISKSSNHPKGSVSKTRRTFLKKYGVDHPNKVDEIFKRGQRSRWDTCILFHWKTNQNLVCRGSYEFAVVNKLNEHNIDFDWQVRIELPNNVIYFCDLYLKKQNKFVELKGTFWTKQNKDKWNTFHKLYSNSEIWFLKEVKDFTGKSSYGLRKDFKEALNAKNQNKIESSLG